VIRLNQCRTNNNPERCGRAVFASRWMRSSKRGSGRLSLIGGLLPARDCRQQGARVGSLRAGILTAKSEGAELRAALDAIAAEHAIGGGQGAGARSRDG
jgi:hypothetical protein